MASTRKTRRDTASSRPPTQPGTSLQARRAGTWKWRAWTIGAPLIVMALALWLRTVDLVRVPAGFFCDEASRGVDAQLIWQTGRDQHGARFPAYFESLGDWIGGFAIYWQVPFVALFGRNEWAVRFASAVAGALTVGLVYLFVSRASGRRVGLWSAALLALSPWHIMQSRVGWEEASLPFCAALFAFFALHGLRRPLLLPWAWVFAALGVYTYAPGRLFFPLLALAWMIIYARPLWTRRRASAVGMVLAAMLLIPFVMAARDGTLFARFEQVSGVAGASASVSQRAADFAAHYAQHFAPGFLLNTPDDPILRHIVPPYGMLYGFQVPFLMLGLGRMLLRRGRFDWLLLAWLLLYPVAASLVSPPISTRSITGVIPFQIITAIGLNWAMGFLLRRLKTPRVTVRRRATLAFAAAMSLWLGVACARFMTVYLGEYPRLSSGFWGWQWGARPISQYFAAHANDYDQMFLNADYNAPESLLRFYLPPDVWSSGRARVANVSDPVIAQYQLSLRQLWGVTQESWPRATLQNLPHRVVATFDGPGQVGGVLLVETGPRVR